MKAAEIERLAAGVEPHDALEAEHGRALRDLVERFDDPWNRYRYDPGHVTASGFVLAPDRRSVALIHHAKLDVWLQPGGHIEEDDASHEAAARREIAEECHVTDLETVGVFDIDIHVFPAQHDQPQHLHFDLRWAFAATTAEMSPGDGALGVRWVPLSEAQSMHESIARPARKLASGIGPPAEYADRS